MTFWPVFWPTVARLGEALILLPAFAAVLLWLALRHRQVGLGVRWLLLLSAATAITTASKVAFIGWGIGHAGLDFTGVSGHAMFACAVMPLLAHAMTATHAPRWQRPALAAAWGLALLVSASRVVTGAHSVSEVLAGVLLGGLVSALAMGRGSLARTGVPKVLVVGVLAWLLATPAGAPPSPTHGWVTRLALELSGRSQPYTREQLHEARLGVSTSSHSTTSTP